MKNPEMLKFVPDHLKTKNMCEHVVKKLPFVIWSIMCDKAVLENGGKLESVSDCYKNQ